MARSISKEGLAQKIEKVEKAISRNREQYNKLTAELEELHKKQKTKKETFLGDLLELSHTMECEPEDWERIQLERYIVQEKMPT